MDWWASSRADACNLPAPGRGTNNLWLQADGLWLDQAAHAQACSDISRAVRCKAADRQETPRYGGRGHVAVGARDQGLQTRGREQICTCVCMLRRLVGRCPPACTPAASVRCGEWRKAYRTIWPSITRKTCVVP